MELPTASLYRLINPSLDDPKLSKDLLFELQHLEKKMTGLCTKLVCWHQTNCCVGDHCCTDRVAHDAAL
jgi:hypothetical protein